MDAQALIERGATDLRRAAGSFSWHGNEWDQAYDLLTHALGREPDLEEPVPAGVQRRFHTLIARRAKGEPLPYITGWTEFFGLRLRVKPGGFVPRATTEFLAESAINRLRRRKAGVHVDLATGIGPVALAVASTVASARVHGTDISSSALAQARANARHLGLGNASFHKGSLFDPLPASLRGAVDVVTAHPPYVSRGEVRELAPELKDFEPKESLTDRSVDGMGLTRRIVADGLTWLRPGGWLLIEIGPSVAREVRALYTRAGYRDVRSTHGEMRHSRVIVGRRP